MNPTLSPPPAAPGALPVPHPPASPAQLGVGARFSLHPMTSDFVDVILRSLAAGDASRLEVTTDDVSTFVRGAEADVTLRPTKGLTLDISAAYTDATVRNFLCPTGAPTSCNINGQPLPYAPKIKLYENAAYRFALVVSADTPIGAFDPELVSLLEKEFGRSFYEVAG